MGRQINRDGGGRFFDRGTSRRTLLKGAGAGLLTLPAASRGGLVGAAPRQLRQDEQTLNVAIAGDIRSLDPYGSNLAVWSLIRFQLYDTLFWIDPETSELIPNLATEWGFDDPTTFLLTLREGVTFHNGAPLTAEDVKFTLDYVRDPNNPTGEFQTRLASVSAVDVVDPLRVRVKLTEANAALPFILSGFFILSHDDSDLVTGPPNGTGPFTYGEWRQNDTFRVERNPNYWQEGRPALAAIVFRVIPEVETRIASLQSGQVDLVVDVDLKDVGRLQGESEIEVAITPPANDYWHAYLNLRRPPFDNLQVRQAVLHAFDRATFTHEFAAGLAEPTNTPLFDGHWAYNPAVADAYPFDMERAAELLAEGGYPGGEGLAFTFIYPPGYPDFRNGSLIMQAAMTELGATVELQELELATWSSKIVTEFDFDIAWDIGGGGTNDPGALYGSSVFLTPSPTNFCGLTEEMLPEYSQLIKEGNATTDQAARIPIYHQIQEIWTANVPDLLFAHRSVAHAHASRVQGFAAPSHGRLRLDEVSIG